MSKLEHHIRKQVFELSVSSESTGATVQKDVTTIWQEELLPEMEGLFDRLSNAIVDLKIDRLELDLGSIPLSQLRKVFSRLLLEEIDRKLGKSLQDTSVVKTVSSRTSRFHIWLEYLQTGIWPWEGFGHAEADFLEAVLESMAAQQIALSTFKSVVRQQPSVLQRLILQHEESFLIAFLGAYSGTDYSSLPPAIKELERALRKFSRSKWLAKVVPSSTKPTINPSTKQIRDHFIFEFLRLEGQLEMNHFVESLLTNRFQPPTEVPILIREFLRGIKASPTNYPILQRWIKPQRDALQTNRSTQLSTIGQRIPWMSEQQEEKTSLGRSLPQRGIENVSQGKPVQTDLGSESSVQKTKSNRKESSSFRHPEITSDSGKNTINRSPKEERRQDLDSRAPEIEKDASQNNILDESTKNEHQPNLGTPASETANGARPNLLNDASTKLTEGPNSPVIKAYYDRYLAPLKENVEATTGHRFYPAGKIRQREPIYLKYAGAVLLHPFLSPFFTNLGLMEKKAFSNKANQYKAAHLFHHLAGGEIQAPEYDMALAKFLCGIPFRESIPRHIQMEKREQNEAKSLLQSVVEHWTALQGCSVEALQEGFFDREGKLERRENGWYLKVEQRTLDLLLDKLPWNIGLVRLPWLEELLHVEWN